MSGMALGIIGTLSTALIFYLTRRCKSMILKHNTDHNFIQTIKKSLSEHKKDHEDINKALKIITRANMHQMKDRIVWKHSQALKNGCISVYDRDTFKGLCTSYYESGGNSFIETLEEEIDKLPSKV